MNIQEIKEIKVKDVKAALVAINKSDIDCKIPGIKKMNKDEVIKTFVYTTEKILVNIAEDKIPEVCKSIRLVLCPKKEVSQEKVISNSSFFKKGSKAEKAVNLMLRPNGLSEKDSINKIQYKNLSYLVKFLRDGGQLISCKKAVYKMLEPNASDEEKAAFKMANPMRKASGQRNAFGHRIGTRSAQLDELLISGCTSDQAWEKLAWTNLTSHVSELRNAGYSCNKEGKIYTLIA